MSVKKAFSKDPKTKIISIKEFYEETEYLCNITNKNLWKNKTVPKAFEVYYKLTPIYLIKISFGGYKANYGTVLKENVEEIAIACRDGKTEYDLFNKKINEFQIERAKFKKSKRLDEQINNLENAKKLIPKYKEPVEAVQKPFESYLVDTGYKTENEKIKNKYIVIDVETNGLRKATDDLLSLSIYDPTTGICYNRFCPLQMQPLVLTTFINGINEKTLAGTTHITQHEINQLYDFFHLKDRIILSFSGGKGTFDSDFIKNYCKRQNLDGFSDLKFENIKNKIPQTPYATEGQLTKDNLCKMFGIEGVKKIHSSYNDCLLEWKLFERIESECLFFIGDALYKYTPEYIIPCSYLNKYPDLIKYANIEIPNIQGKANELLKIEFPKKILKQIKKFPTNITGITIEHAINSFLKAEKQDNILFLSQNKSHLKYVGSLHSRLKEIPIIAEEDGKISAIFEEDKKYIEEVNNVTSLVVEYIKPVADYLKSNIFTNGKILTQELSVSNDKKVLALCDLSDDKSVVEIKTSNYIIDENNILRKNIARQLYYQANGRKTYILSIVFDTEIHPKTFKQIVNGLNVFLYEIELFEYDPSSIIHTKTLSEHEIKVLKLIINNPFITKSKMSESISNYLIPTFIENLIKFKYIKKDNPRSRKEPWEVLRTAEDITTRYTCDGENIHIIK